MYSIQLHGARGRMRMKQEICSLLCRFDEGASEIKLAELLGKLLQPQNSVKPRRDDFITSSICLFLSPFFFLSAGCNRVNWLLCPVFIQTPREFHVISTITLEKVRIKSCLTVDEGMGVWRAKAQEN